MCLIQRFAIVCVSAAPNLGTAAQFHLNEPIGIGQRLAGKAHNIRVTVLQNGFGFAAGCAAVAMPRRKGAFYTFGLRPYCYL